MSLMFSRKLNESVLGNNFASGLYKFCINDYYAGIVGRWAMGAQYSLGYVATSGIQVALQRRAHIRLGTHALPMTALAADLELY